jgi:hypothetical protein
MSYSPTIDNVVAAIVILGKRTDLQDRDNARLRGVVIEERVTPSVVRFVVGESYLALCLFLLLGLI